MGKHINPRRQVPLLERFWAKVNQNGPVPPQREDLGSCWLWIGGLGGGGYGKLSKGKKREGNVVAHIFAYETFVGPVPPGMELDHLCRNRTCVRPTHVEPVTHRENLQRGDTFQARNARKTHCSKGHPFDTTNTKLDVDTRHNCTHRRCRTCSRYYSRQWKAKRNQQHHTESEGTITTNG